MRSLELADLEQIVGTVDREYERLRGGRKRLRIGGFQRFAFWLLQVVAYSIPVCVAVPLLLGSLGWGGSWLSVLLIAWLLLAVVLLLPLILINLPLMVTAWRQRRPIVSRGLLVPAVPAWQTKARWVVLAVGIVAAILAVTVEDFGWAGFSLVLLVVIVPFLLLMMKSFLRLAEHNLELMRDVQELRVVLSEKLAEARRESRTAVELPHEVAVKVSDTARGILGNERLRAIDKSTQIPLSDFSLSQSSAFRESVRSLEPAIRLRITDCLQELAANHGPPGAHRDEATGYWVWGPADLGVELVYEIVDESRQIRVREARPSPPSADGETQGRG